MQFTNSTELFINIKDKPLWDPRKPYYEQSREVLQFFGEERRKITEGVNIGGYIMHPWLYFHINFFITPIPVVNERTGKLDERLMSPPLDDIMLYVTESYQEAEENNLGLFLFGTRGATKSTILTSLIQWLNTTKENGTTSVMGGSQPDLNQISRLLQTAFDKVHPAFRVPRIRTDWTSEVVFGVKEKNNTPLVHSTLSITNANKGSKKESEKGAGLSPVGWISDESGKYDFLGPYMSALPSFMTQHGAKLVPILSGCVCKGTKVFDNQGNICNIEDLDPEQGILGYDIKEGIVSKEGITYWQPPHTKPCYRITTNKGRELECSDDHPILIRDKFPKGGYKKTPEFRETRELKVGDSLAVVKSLDREDMFGDVEMFDPYLIGMLIGDGTYSKTNGTKLHNADPDVLNYVKERYTTNTFFSAPTKDGRTLEKMTISGIVPKLRELGIKDQARETKTLPKEIGKYNRDSLIKLIEGYYDADGCYYVSSNDDPKQARFRECLIKLTSCGKNLLEETRMLLLKFGIHGNIVHEKLTENSSVKSTRGHYNLIIKTADSLLKFSETFTPKIAYKKEKLEEIRKIQLSRNAKEPGMGGLLFEMIKGIEYIGEKPVYNLTAGTTHTYIANGIVTHNTGGNQELSQDAKKVLHDPKSYNILTMDYERLERNVPEEFITWERSKKSNFGTFIPGQMSYRLEVKKVEEPLSKFVKGDKKILDKIKVKATDWEKATTVLQDRVLNQKDEEKRNKDKMYFPLETADCFLTQSINPFPTKIIDRHIRYLEDEGKTGRNVELIKDGSKTTSIFSPKQRADVHHPGGEADAPIIVYGSIPEERPIKYVNVSGFDGYKIDGSDTDSLGSLYVLKRRNLEPNTPCETIECSYTSRPDKMKDFHRQCETIIETWNSECCMESIDMGLAQYLDMKGKAEALLAPAFTFAKGGGHSLRSRFGLPPTAGNNEYRFNLLIEYCKEMHTLGIDEDGNEITKYGVEFIDDIDLLKEMMNYYKGGNFDRITAFSHALVHSRQLDLDGIFPMGRGHRNKLQDYEEKPKVNTRNPYGTRRLKRY